MIPLFSPEQVREADNYCIDKLGIPGLILMENAARTIAEFVLAENPDLRHVGIICGKGNNAGDGIAVARHLAIKGIYVSIVLVAEPQIFSGDAQFNFNLTKNLALENSLLEIIQYKDSHTLRKIQSCDLIIDALLGTGIRGEITEPFSTVIDELNSLRKKVLSIDLPSGLDSSTGWGNPVVNATSTITLGEFKRGLFFGKGAYSAGIIHKGYIGLNPKYFDELEVNDYLIEPEDAYKGIPKKAKDIQKYSAGKLMIIAGSSDYPGASVFSANAASASGCGAVTVFLPDSVKGWVVSTLRAATINGYDDKGTGKLKTEHLNFGNVRFKSYDTMLIGPGLGNDPDTLAAVESILLEYPEKFKVIDADGLLVLNKKKYDLSTAVLTPHLKEFSLMSNISIEELKKNLLLHGRNYAVKNRTTLVLKGMKTIIFNASGECFINSAGNQGLAKFGSGDVLAGIIASFIAQSGIIEDSVIASVYIHSLAADIIAEKEGYYGIDPEKLINGIPSTIKFLLATFD